MCIFAFADKTLSVKERSIKWSYFKCSYLNGYKKLEGNTGTIGKLSVSTINFTYLKRNYVRMIS